MPVGFVERYIPILNCQFAHRYGVKVLIMQDQNTPSQVPTFSPMLFAGFALRPLPIVLFRPLVQHILKRIEFLYPAVFQRLAPLGHSRFLIMPVDFHFCFLLSLDEGKATIEVLSKDHDLPDADTTISGPMLSLIQLLEGTVDGDALFFSREINVQGDTEAVLTLRNAVDSVDISFEEIMAGRLAVLKPLLDKALSRAVTLYGAVQRDFQQVHNSLVAPLTLKVSQIDDDLDRQEDRMMKIEKELKKIKTSRRNSTAKMVRT
ncbi:ubiquinone anaerobic biosynthesis accessory factor UbiT [Kiloniella sp.]|uniref:ubiquinone anaerobic biosynthesis accessory factor UbiT n=1 Tax=Kiloniella sp. TaxID=1938587 RepID=UPI003B01B5C8